MKHQQETLQAKLNDVNQELIVTRRECDRNQSMVDDMENIIDNIFKIHDEAISGGAYYHPCKVTIVGRNSHHR